MAYNPRFHNRQTHRLRGYDYTRAGVYFVTLVSQNRECLFGEVLQGRMIMNECGAIAADCWTWLQEQYAHVDLDTWVIMPNHLHGIIILNENQPPDDASLAECRRKPLGRLIGAFKTTSTRQINQLRAMSGVRIWQRDFHDHLVRDEEALRNIRRYIRRNPAQWKNP